MKKFIAICMAALAFVSCSHNKPVSVVETIEPVPVKPRINNFVKAYPNATAFRMSGDYSKNVAVTLGPDGELIYFPAPTDITADSEPISLGDGWWLNCQGISPNSVFTKYTFTEYASLTETPSTQQIKQAILPGAKVTEFIELPITLNEATSNIEATKKYVAK